eukprot:SAG11_NODE_3252_length_2577_cov_71.390234_2_plen_114_part_00
MPIGTGASFSLGVSPAILGYLLPLVITLGSYKLSRQFVIVPLNMERVLEQRRGLNQCNQTAFVDCVRLDSRDSGVRLDGSTAVVVEILEQPTSHRTSHSGEPCEGKTSRGLVA